MFPLIGGLISGGASLLGSIFSSQTSAQNTQAQIAGQQMLQQQSESFNAWQAQANRDFQESMSSTAFQRASKDMQAAGLNPAAMFGGASAASSPGGSAASVGTAGMPTPMNRHPLEGIGRAVSDGLNAAISAKTVDKMTEEIANLLSENARIKATTANIGAATETERERPAQVRQMTRTEEQRTGLEEARKILTASGIPEATIKRLEDLGVLDNIKEKDIGKIGLGKYGIGALNKAVDAALPFVSGAKSALKYMHEWKGSPSFGLTPSQTRDLYNRFESMRGN